MTLAQARFVQAGKLMSRLCILGAVLALRSISLSAPPDEDRVDLSQLRARVSQLQERVTELAGDDDLLDTLHFGWLDRPYARATLAILVKTTSMLEREVYLRELGNGAIRDATVRNMLSWAKAALERVMAPEPDSGFRPHRLRVTGADFLAVRAVPPLYAFVDRATLTRHDDSFGDLDLLAAMGMRVYPRMASDLLDPDSADVTAARAAALGMAAVCITAGKDDEATVIAGSGGEVTTIRVASLRDLLEGMPNASGPLCALTGPVIGESWAASLARRAVARGVLDYDRYVTVDWSPPTIRGGSADRTAATAAAMWVHAIEGQSLGLLPGWRDLRDGSASPFPSVLLDPAGVETIARTALDLIRLGDFLRPFGSTPPLAVAVGPDAIHAGDDNAWASWIEPIWEMLLDRQIRFDVIGAHKDKRQLSRRCPVVFSLHRDDAGDRTSVMLRIERALALQSDHVHRITARAPDGRLASDVFVRDARSPGGRPCVAVANLSNRSRRVKLRGGPRLGVVRDVLADELIRQPGESVPLAPWQVRLLWPAD